MKPNHLLAGIAILALSCGESTTETTPGKVDQEKIKNHLVTLSSDEFLGRKPFTEGETKTVNYLVEEVKKLKLEPGNGDSYTQEVKLVELDAKPSAAIAVSGNGNDISLTLGDDFVAYTERVEERVELKDSELIFAGYGVVAPEYNWNDYEGLDVAGKTVVVLVNDPGFGSGDSTLFKGDVMTYYGRWTYKYEEARRQGAAGVLIVHETVPAGYPWTVVRNSWSGASLYLDSEGGGDDRPQLLGWLTRDKAIEIFKASGKDLSNFNSKSKAADFKAIPLGMNISIDIENGIKKDVSKNVVAKITGSKNPDEYVIYSAHWDHLGVGIPIDGDSIYNGAHDNGSGSSVMLAIAEQFAKGPKPDRTVVFLWVTAEEQGLLGSAYYAENPIFEPSKTIANINMDGINYYGLMKDLTIVGYGQSELDDIAGAIAEKQGRYVIPDPEPGKGYFFRSDHFNFAKVGIPAIFAYGSYESMDKGVDYVKQLSDKYNQTMYHRPQDEYSEDWDLSGMQQDGQLFYEMGLQISTSGFNVSWKEGSEFKSIRETSLK
ncbi:MAG: M28 family metallopeptidase [bacterium]|nr:M28 family metallopeptidase [bacterium]